MQAFTVTEDGPRPGIAVVRKPWPHVPLGNKRIPIGLDDFPTAVNILERCSPIRSFAKKTLILVGERDKDDPRAIVRVHVVPGYRGIMDETCWTGVDCRVRVCPLQGEHVGLYRCELCRVALPASLDKRLSPDNPDNVHPNHGNFKEWDPFPAPPAVTLVDEGTATDRPVGGLRSTRVRLLVLEPGAAFRVHRKGKLSQTDVESVYVRWTGKALLCGSREDIGNGPTA